MGMPVGIDVRDGEVSAVAVAEAFEWLRFVDATFSTYKDESEISRLNRGFAEPLVEFIGACCVRHRDQLRAVQGNLRNQFVEIISRGQSHHAKTLGEILHDLQRLPSDRAGTSENRNGFHSCFSGLTKRLK